ncbi:MAG: hypothetical protein LBU04_01015 [Christensenellaceae bacterium]|jgi:hypothetical protein|nr:hypothetical protein [Christensenellaceae bacterium]
MEYNYYKSYRLHIIEFEESLFIHQNVRKYNRMFGKLRDLFYDGILKNDNSTQYILSLLNDDNIYVKTHVALKCVNVFCMKKYYKTDEHYAKRIKEITFEAIDKILEIINPYLKKSLEVLEETAKQLRLGLFTCEPDYLLNIYYTGSQLGNRFSVIAEEKEREKL